MRYVSALPRILLGPLLLAWAFLPGCQSRGSDEELGTIVYEVPKVPGSDKPFPIPELDPKAKSRQSAAPVDPMADPSSVPPLPLPGFKAK
ncbi:MAG TPA: hypothetical protein VJL29_03810 [Thermoguttaceae bacterium]|nr:hypothetical protein [Thermoguttaceae bacterium]